MNDDRFEQLLRDADGSGADDRTNKPTAGPWALAERVRSVARRRTIVRRAIGGTAAFAVAIVATVVFQPRSPKPAPQRAVIATPSPIDPRAELLALRAEADREAERAARMITSQRRLDRDAVARRALALPDPAERSRQQLERAALSIVYEADRQAARGAPAARQLYAAAAESFPNTHWAAVARERLAVERERKDGSG